MALLRSSFALLLLYSVSSVFGEYLQVILGDPVKFPAIGNCAKGEAARLVYRVDHHRTRQVAVLREGIWMPSDHYQDRVTSVNSSVLFNRTFYGDKGKYELTCGGSERIIFIELDVVLAYDASVTEGKTVTLRCHFKGQYVEWKRNGTLVLRLNCPSGNIIYGTGSKGKVSVLPDGCKQGDFSLTMKEAQLEDEGDYFCNVQSDGKKARGNPAAVRLTINPKETNHTSCPTLNSPTEDKQPETGTNKSVTSRFAVAIVVALVLGIGLGIGFGWLLKSRCSSASPGPRGGTDPDVAKPLNSQYASPAQVNGCPGDIQMSSAL